MKKGKQVTFGEAMRDFMKRYFDFKGRSTRASFLWVLLTMVIVMGVLFTLLFHAIRQNKSLEILLLTGLTILIIIVFLVPYLAVYVRRVRDAGFTGAGILIILLCNGAINILTELVTLPIGAMLEYMITVFVTVIALAPTDELVYKKENKLINFFLRKE